MTKIWLLLMLVGAWGSAKAELTFPVDPTGKWVLIDVTNCSTVGPVPRPYPGPADGSDPGYGSQYKLLRYVEAKAFPSYDSNLSRAESSFLMCGPDTQTCYDTTTVHESGTGCSAINQMEQIRKVVALSKKDQIVNLNTRAALAIIEAIPEEDRQLMTLLVGGMLMFLIDQDPDRGTLPTVEGINLEDLYAKYKQTINVDVVVPVLTRRDDLKKRIEDGTIQDGEIDLGWPPVVD